MNVDEYNDKRLDDYLFSLDEEDDKSDDYADQIRDEQRDEEFNQ